MMIKKGFLIAIKNDMPVAINNVKAPLNISVTKFKMGEFVDDKYQEGLIRMTKVLFNKKFENNDLSFQEELWEDLRQLKKTKTSESNDIRSRINEFKTILDIEDIKLSKTYETIDFIKNIFEEVAEDNGSKDGLEYFINKNDSELSSGTLEGNFKSFSKIYTWLESPFPMDIRGVNVAVNGYRNYISEKEEYNELLTRYESIKELLKNGDEFI